MDLYFVSHPLKFAVILFILLLDFFYIVDLNGNLCFYDSLLHKFIIGFDQHMEKNGYEEMI